MYFVFPPSRRCATTGVATPSHLVIQMCVEDGESGFICLYDTRLPHVPARILCFLHLLPPRTRSSPPRSTIRGSTSQPCAARSPAVSLTEAFDLALDAGAASRR